MTTKLPLFYFKPTVCWVDDDQLFLDAARHSFNQYHCVTINDPQRAVDFFNAYQAPLAGMTFKRDFTESDVFGVGDHCPVDIDIPAIRELLALPQKSQEIAVLVVDYNMPGMDGVALCEQLRAFLGKKILLTGEATHEKAVEAFNKGLISKFIRKDHNTADKLRGYIDELINLYFYEKTANLLSHMEASKPSLLSDRCFADFFSSWRHDNSAEEYYLINRQGGYLVKDKNGKMAYLIVMSESHTAEFVTLNDELTDKVGYLLDEMASGKRIPFFGLGKESWDVDVGAWGDYFYPAQVIEGRERYYWAVVDA